MSYRRNFRLSVVPYLWLCMLFFNGFFKLGKLVFMCMILHTHAMIMNMAVYNGMFVKGTVMIMRENMRMQMGMVFY